MNAANAHLKKHWRIVQGYYTAAARRATSIVTVAEDTPGDISGLLYTVRSSGQGKLTSLLLCCCVHLTHLRF